MSRLNSFIRRITAQRDCLNRAFELVEELAGPVLELGLGNGRTYNHIREGCPGREVFVFERKVAAHPDDVPDAEHLISGDLYETLPGALARIGRPAVLAHVDIGSGRPERDRAIAAFISTHLPPLMADRAVILSDQRLELPGWKREGLPEGVAPGRYHFFSRGLGEDRD